MLRGAFVYHYLRWNHNSAYRSCRILNQVWKDKIVFSWVRNMPGNRSSKSNSMLSDYLLGRYKKVWHPSCYSWVLGQVGWWDNKCWRLRTWSSGTLSEKSSGFYWTKNNRWLDSRHDYFPMYSNFCRACLRSANLRKLRSNKIFLRAQFLPTYFLHSRNRPKNNIIRTELLLWVHQLFWQRYCYRFLCDDHFELEDENSRIAASAPSYQSHN